MAEWSGFWSYVRSDDEANRGRISQLAKDVEAEYQVLTAESIEIFLDREAIEWGDNWKERIDESLATTAFFVPVLTPRYFTRPECRRELGSFIRRATSLGLKELVLPILFVNVPALEEKNPTDELVALIQAFQYEDWRDLRFRDPASEEYRRGVARLAERLVRAGAQAQQVDIVAQMTPSDAKADEAPGTLDRLAAGEAALVTLTTTTESITHDIEAIGELMQQATADMEGADARGQGFVGRLSIARRLSNQLQAPVEDIWSLSNTFVSELHDVDGLMRTFMELAPEACKEPEDRKNILAFFDSVREFERESRVAMDGTQQMIDSIEPIDAMSKDLRPPMRRLRQGLTLMVEARAIVSEWVQLIDAVTIHCIPGPLDKSWRTTDTGDIRTSLTGNECAAGRSSMCRERRSIC